MMTIGNVKTIASQALGGSGLTSYRITADQEQLEIRGEYRGKHGTVVWPLAEFTPNEVELAARGCAALLKRMITDARST